ncbi:leucine-rich repeat and fibronectin type-III domain-containing protein hattifattener isoform X2 [Anticarsia gemmatalis]|uniref:leucine-rich repeat and fibronectin type-III domain-containing protein hattifattener isoform X2 n=1 Tax=Anticarsia gemmatalis TaxID=129554 RepID=UPI003F777111
MGKLKQSRPRACLSSVLFLIILHTTSAQCPWEDAPALQAACVCAHNLASDLSVQCDQVDFPTLLSALNMSARNVAIDLLYINNSSIPALTHNMFTNLKIHNLQISGCGIKKIEDDAFRGQGPYLKNLNLQDNELTEVPIKALKILVNLSLLDISKNRITHIDNHSFITLRKLTTLKVSDNNVTLEPLTLSGLENSLKNLNLKGTKQKTVPECIRGLRSLAFLDLSQNSIRELPGPDGIHTFEGLESLTALNLERNLIVHLSEDAFAGIKTTLSSLSLLNNLLPEFPTAAIGSLSDLRVLDIGFNLLNKLPRDAFINNPSITLLALDGNPLPTVPEEAFSHLNQTLRGLSLGGRFLNCDCRLRWIIEWIRNGELQVTSRERNPQFCGHPAHFRERGFYSFEPNELVCEHDVTTTERDSTTIKDSNDWKLGQVVTTTSTTTTHRPSTSSTSTTTSTTTTPEIDNNIEIGTKAASLPPTTTSTARPSRIPSVRPAAPTWRHAPHQRPPLVMSFPQQKKVDDSNEVIVKNAYRQDNSVIIQWDSDVANILGFRVVYRLFGDKSFKQGPPLEASEREFKIKNVPSQECIVVCVISLEEVHVSPETVPYSQCREVRTVSAAASNMDKITIAASAAICGTIVVAVLVFAAASRRRSRTVHRLHTQAPEKMPNPCCGGLTGTPSPSGPLSSLATIGAFGKQHLRQSRQSLGAASERASRLSLSGAAGGATGGTAGSRRRPRSRSRPASRYSVGSLGMGYCDTSDNWTDHDMDIYMARNPTTRSGLVPL